MKRKSSRFRLLTISFLSLAFVTVALIGCSRKDSGSGDDSTAGVETAGSSPKRQLASDNGQSDQTDGTLVTFVELGSDRCVPCIMMREVIEKIEQQYGEQVRIVFYDVWTEAGKPYAHQFRIRVIPTQVFLDNEGVEYYRHEGYLPFEQVKEILAQKGVETR